MLGHAGATLVGNSQLVPSWTVLPFTALLYFPGSINPGETGFQRSERELQLDWNQLKHPTAGHTVGEIRAEINGDYVGRDVGGILSRLRAGSIGADEARKQIFDKLCDH
jgi:hypothetical protein